jgi:hypothetical protein
MVKSYCGLPGIARESGGVLADGFAKGVRGDPGPLRSSPTPIASSKL